MPKAIGEARRGAVGERHPARVCVRNGELPFAREYAIMGLREAQGEGAAVRSRPMTAIYNGFCFCMVLLAGAFRLVGKQARHFSYNSIIFVLFTAAITL